MPHVTDLTPALVIRHQKDDIGPGASCVRGEFGWILEHNYAMRKPLEKLGSKVYKRYRMYDRDLDPSA